MNPPEIERFRYIVKLTFYCNKNLNFTTPYLWKGFELVHFTELFEEFLKRLQTCSVSFRWGGKNVLLYQLDMLLPLLPKHSLLLSQLFIYLVLWKYLETKIILGNLWHARFRFVTKLLCIWCLYRKRN